MCGSVAAAAFLAASAGVAQVVSLSLFGSTSLRSEESVTIPPPMVPPVVAGSPEEAV